MSFIRAPQSVCTDKQKEDAGVFEDLIRVSVGIEDIDDLKDDFAQAFANIAD